MATLRVRLPLQLQETNKGCCVAQQRGQENPENSKVAIMYAYILGLALCRMSFQSRSQPLH